MQQIFYISFKINVGFHQFMKLRGQGSNARVLVLLMQNVVEAWKYETEYQ